MSRRISELEDALFILQSRVSTDPHPLLKDDLSKIKFGSEVLNAPRKAHPSDGQKPTEQTIEALGTLSLSEGGSTFFGRSGGSEVCHI